MDTFVERLKKNMFKYDVVLNTPIEEKILVCRAQDVV
jgi:hypothetical protein